MKILDIDHVEFYAGDADTLARSLCGAYGFRVYGRGGPETGLPGQRSVLVGQGAIRVLLTSGLYADHRASQFVARHGDGAAVIALRTDSAANAYGEADAAGARSVSEPRTWENDEARVVAAEIEGFADVVYRLIDRDGADSEFQPGAIVMEPGVGTAAADDLLTRIDHAAVCVPAGDLAPTVGFHEEVLGFTTIFQEYVEVGAQGITSKVVQSPSGGATFTFIEPDPGRQAGHIDDFLAWHGGAGVQHLAYLTDDIVAAVRTFAGRGARFAVTPPSYHDMLEARLGVPAIPVEQLRPLGILADRDHWGQMYQIFTQSMHSRRTYFEELIDRRGARTFGMNNISALYAAKERELAGTRQISGMTHD